MSARRNPVANRMTTGYFQSTEDGIPELSDQQAVPPADQAASQPSIPIPVGTFEQPAIQKRKRTKRTFYLEEEAVVMLRRLQSHRFQQSPEDKKKEPELSELVTEAIMLLGASQLPDS